MPALAGTISDDVNGRVESARNLRMVTVQLPWKFQFEFSPFLIALKKGYFREAGITVDLREWVPGTNVVDEVSSGRIAFGMYSSALVLERARGKPVVALAVLMQHSPVALLVKRKADISSVLDLAGKRIAFSHDTEDELLAYLRANGMGPDKYNVLPRQGFGLETLDKDQADAIGIYSSNEAYLSQQQGDTYFLLRPRSAGIDFFGNVLFTSEQLLKKEPQLVQRFRAATLRGLDYALKHPEEAIDLILTHYNTQYKSRAHLEFEAHEVAELTRPDIVEPGYMNLNRWRHVAQTYAELGKMPADVDLAEFDLTAFLYDPTPTHLDQRLLWLLVGVTLALLGAAATGWQFRRINQRLRSEMSERKAIADELLASNAHLQQAMQQLVHNEKMAALGTLVAGVAHELNTPIGTAYTVASTLLEVTDAFTAEVASGTMRRSSLQHYAERCRQAADLVVRNTARATQLISGFKELAVDQTSERQRQFDLGATVDELLLTLTPLIRPSGHQVINDIPSGIVLDSYPGPISQVLSNLIQNSLLHGFADLPETEHGKIQLSASVVDKQVQLDYRDNGKGMASHVAARAFDPFFTTRLGSGGSGLGLSIVHNLITDLLGGSVTLRSAPGAGVHFQITLPISLTPKVRDGSART